MENTGLLKTNIGIKINRRFTVEAQDSFETVDWERRNIEIKAADGSIVFSQKATEFPKSWSPIASQIVASKYFSGKLGDPDREFSLKQVIHRVGKAVRKWGIAGEYFEDKKSADIFYEELKYILLKQYASFNSPVWFNIGIDKAPQCSACFILSVEDSMESILELAKIEGLIFKNGSGAGSNLSSLRSKNEELSSGGYASGPVSFMKGYDTMAGTIKSGGRTRRAAKMVLLDAEHPDIVEFIRAKVKEEKKAWALIEAGYEASFSGDAYTSVSFQNANHSVRLSDEFMTAATETGEWKTRYVTTGKVARVNNAKNILEEISNATYICGDPGVQYKDTINKWNTCKNSGMINGSNPCSEYVFLDNTACNLASINLLKLRNEDSSFNVEAYKHVIDILILAQEIIVGNGSYPTKQIEENSRRYRTLGLGYTNLGALLMSLGLPYDSEKGRNYATAVTSILSGHAYLQSARIAKKTGAFEGYETNREPMLEVIKLHKRHAEKIKNDGIDNPLHEYATNVWKLTLQSGEKFGFRNAQVTVLAPTGTISFMMDADTTGIEPELALVKFKKLVDGGQLNIVNHTISLALKHLGYSKHEQEKILKDILESGTVEESNYLDKRHLQIFDTSFKPLKGKRSIHFLGHIKMMAAVQPFLSGAISKTVNMPEDSTIKDIMDAYIEGWKLGVKSIAIYRNNSKRLQPLNIAKPKDEENKKKAESDAKVEASSRTGKIEHITPLIRQPQRIRLKETRKAKIHRFEVDGHEGYITVGLYENGTPGEVFITIAKQGSTLGGFLDSFAVLLSISLQYGVPLSALVNKFIHTKFEPAGYTSNKEIPIASSIIDYIFRWLALEFFPEEERPQTLLNKTNNIKWNNICQKKTKLLKTRIIPTRKCVSNAEQSQYKQDHASCVLSVVALQGVVKH